MVIRISTSKYKALSQISTDIGQIFFASLVISPLLVDFDQKQIGATIVGGILSLIFWYSSLYFAEKGKLWIE